MSGADLAFMRRALALAAAGLGRVAPNPSVGCVIVKAGAVLSEARTGDGGRPHAEETALALAGTDAVGATAYVTLEPCSARSVGKASCATLLLRAGVARIVVACRDPHPNGQGLPMLQNAGTIVDVGVLEAEAEALNAGFFTRIRTGRPLVVSEDFDAELELRPGEDEGAALDRAGAAGLTRVALRRA